jgi:hypothetical protein
VGEADGLGKYGTEPDVGGRGWVEQLRREKAREDRLRDLGFEVVRWTATDLRAPTTLLRRFEAAVGRAQPGRIAARTRIPARIGPPQQTG